MNDMPRPPSDRLASRVVALELDLLVAHPESYGDRDLPIRRSRGSALEH
jgi:hypothetical protein